VVSVATPLVLLLGTSTGLRLATLVCLMLAVAGARRLGWLWTRDPWAAAAAGLLYGINGGVLVYTVAGHFIPMSYCALPWLLLCAFQLGTRTSAGLGLGFWTAFDLLNGVQYPSIYALILTAAVWLRAVRVQTPEGRRRVLVQTLLAVGVCLALGGWRIATTALVVRDYPRVYFSMFGGSPRDLLSWLLDRPGPDVLRTTSVPQFWESTCYVGPLALVLVVVSLRWGWRWWHALALLCLWLSLGEEHWTKASYWLAQAPVFRSMHVVTRWRIPAMLGLGLAAADCLAHWRRAGGYRRALVPVVVVLLAADYLMYGLSILPVATSVAPSEDLFPGPPTAELVNVETAPSYPALLRGYGVIRAHEPMLGYNRTLPTARLWRGHPRYRGEFWIEGGSVRVESWSPNRIVLQAEPGQEVHVNQNPGSWWRINGRLAFPEWRCAEWEKPFAARADSRGRLVLEIEPKGRALGLGLHALGAVLVLGALGASRFAPAIQEPAGAARSKVEAG
jgi:hypothetical protein